ncbi:hypothetical protein APW58_10960 [Staphylococcus aureus]|nr:hypothetical protein APW58_10960 [Staphylococcus aureus]
MTNERKEVSEAPVNFGANLGLMLDLYDDFLQDPSSVPEDLQVLFSTIKNDDSIVPALKSTSSQNSDGTIKRVMRLIDNIRQYGHLKADIYPVNFGSTTEMIKNHCLFVL